MISNFVIPQQCRIPKNAYGIWQIPELNIIIPLYEKKNKTAQQIIDEELCALILPFGKGRIILDHSGSNGLGEGYWDIGMVHPDMIAFLTTNKNTIQYQCNAVYKVQCKGSQYFHENRFIYPVSSLDIACNCCVGTNVLENYMAMFKYKGIFP